MLPKLKTKLMDQENEVKQPAEATTETKPVEEPKTEAPASDVPEKVDEPDEPTTHE